MTNEPVPALTIWTLRVLWATLPVTAGGAVDDALAKWSGAEQTVAGVLLWGAWVLALVAVLAPRPIGATVARTVAVAFVGVAALSAPRTTVSVAVLALGCTVAAATLVCTATVGRAFADGAAYGDERRFPLRVPPVLLCGPVPIAIVLVSTGVAVGPLLLAGGHLVGGLVAVAVGMPIAFWLSRSLHQLSRRWLVLVPAGIVVVDPMTLADPVLCRREDVAAITPLDPRVPVRADDLDLRLGASLRSVALRLERPLDWVTARRGRRAGRSVTATTALVAPVQPRRFRRLAAARNPFLNAGSGGDAAA